MSNKRPTIAALYHFFPPDDVVSAVLFGELCSGLVKRGWNVTAYPSIWNCHRDDVRHPSTEEWRGVQIRRLWRPRIRQTSAAGRLANAVWMVMRWSLLSITAGPHPDVLIVGTDPVLSVLVAPVWKMLSPRTRIVHWCFDLYPEAAIADGLLPRDSRATKTMKYLLRRAYATCELIADIGPCMRRLLTPYAPKVRRETITPWALKEYADLPATSLEERKALFGEASLALLYSGSFGRAHSYEALIDLAERLEGQGGLLAFSVRGNREAELRAAVRERNLAIRFVPFAAEHSLSDRLTCADVHVVSLHPQWTGTVVPSKFFGALAAGRPVLFAGSDQSSIAQWIREYQVGWVLNVENVEGVAAELIRYSQSQERKAQMQKRCLEVYRALFSRETQLDKFDKELKSILSSSRSDELHPTTEKDSSIRKEVVQEKPIGRA